MRNTERKSPGNHVKRPSPTSRMLLRIAAAALLLCGCSEATQITVHVEHDAPLPQGTTLEVDVWREGSTMLREGSWVDPDFPATLAVVPTNGVLGVVFAEARITSEGQTRTRRSSAAFQDGTNVALHLDFDTTAMDGGAPDGDIPNPDGGPALPDGSIPSDDGGTPSDGGRQVDANAPQTDASIATPDGGMPEVDSGSPTDGGTPVDGGAPSTDAGTTSPDAGILTPCGPLSVPAGALEVNAIAASPGATADLLAVATNTQVHLFRRTPPGCFVPAGTRRILHVRSLHLNRQSDRAAVLATLDSHLALSPIADVDAPSLGNFGATNTASSSISGDSAAVGLTNNSAYLLVQNGANVRMFVREPPRWDLEETLNGALAFDTYEAGALILQGLTLRVVQVTDPVFARIGSAVPIAARHVPVAGAIGDGWVVVATANLGSVQHCFLGSGIGGGGWRCMNTPLPGGTTHPSLSQRDVDGGGANAWAALGVDRDETIVAFHGLHRTATMQLPLPGATGHPSIVALSDGVAYIDDASHVRLSLR